MVKHIVFFSFVNESEGKSKAEHALIIKKNLENLIHLIPELKKIEVGVNHEKAPKDNYDLVLNSEFDSWEDLDAYQIHPEHQKVAGYIGKIKTARAAIDYEF